MSAAPLSSTSTWDPEVEAERRRALRALLRKPLLTAIGEDAEEYILVRRHFSWLQQWLAKFPAWTLRVEQDVARLRKTPADLHDDTRGATDSTTGIPFSRRKYALLCLVLAALQRSDRQTTLRHIVEAVHEFIAADPSLQAAGLAFDTAGYDQRRDLMHAIRLLSDCGLLREVDGASDVLYEIHRSMLAVVSNASHGAPVIDADTTIRARLVRALLDDPVLYFEDLSSEERQYFAAHGSYLLRQIHEATGLIPEIRREGIAMTDDAGDLADVQLFEEAGVLEWLARYARQYPGAAVPIDAIQQKTRQLDDTLLRLRGLRLIQVTTDGVVPLSAVGRYARDINTQE
jgi:Protein of unknown function (DUF2398)